MRKLSILGCLIWASCSSTIGNTGGEDGNNRVEFVPCEHQDGTRLKERFEETGEGVRKTILIFDSSLGVDCAQSRFTDGTIRCLPTELRDGDVVFEDAQCNEALVGFRSGTRLLLCRQFARLGVKS